MCQADEKTRSGGEEFVFLCMNDCHNFGGIGECLSYCLQVVKEKKMHEVMLFVDNENRCKSFSCVILHTVRETVAVLANKIPRRLS